jgi:hypothetical protein
MLRKSTIFLRIFSFKRKPCRTYLYIGKSRQTALVNGNWQRQISTMCAQTHPYLKLLQIQSILVGIYGVENFIYRRESAVATFL